MGKNGRLILLLLGNTFHSNLLLGRWEQMDTEKAGLDAIGASGIPVTASYQSMDYEILPWLKETLAKYPSIQMINAPNSHALIPLYNEEMMRWETKKIIGDVPATFFAEFYAPRAQFIPTKFFPFLEGMTYAYSDFSGEGRASDIISGTLPDALSIKVGDRIGIIMKDKLFKPFLDAWFRFQRDPVTVDNSTNNKLPLDHLLDQVEAIAESGNVVVCPLDIETAFIGSVLGKKVYELFFKGIKARGLESVFGHLSEYLDYFEAEAMPSKHPHRILTKWSTYEIQVKYLMSLSKIYPKNKKAHMLLSTASCSDILSAWERKIGEAQRKIVLNGRDLGGNEVKLPISYNQDIIDVQDAARQALQKKTSYQNLLQDLSNQSLFVQRMTAYAEKYGL